MTKEKRTIKKGDTVKIKQEKINGRLFVIVEHGHGRVDDIIRSIQECRSLSYKEARKIFKENFKVLEINLSKEIISRIEWLYEDYMGTGNIILFNSIIAVSKSY